MYLLQALIICAVVGWNVYRQWTPNPHLAAGIGVFLAWCATQAVNEWRDRTGFVQYSFIAQRMVHVRR